MVLERLSWRVTCPNHTSFRLYQLSISHWIHVREKKDFKKGFNSRALIVFSKSTQTILSKSGVTSLIASWKFRRYVNSLKWNPHVFPSSCGLTFSWWGCYGLCQRHKPSKLAHSFLFCSCISFCHYGPFNYISFQKFPGQLSIFSLCFSDVISALLVLSTTYLFMKVSCSPDMIPSGWLGPKPPIN